MKKGVRPVRLKIETPLPIYWNDVDDLENKIDYSELFNDYAKTYHEDIVIPVIEILPDETTQLAPFRLQKHLIKFGEEEVLRHAKENEYDLDEADEAFLAAAKEYPGVDGAPPFRFTADSFERIMDYFEKESFQQREHEQVVLQMQPSTLLQAANRRFRASWHVRDKKPEAAEKKRPEAAEKDDSSVECLGESMPDAVEPEDALCCICGEGDSDAANKIVFCEGCTVAVHQRCHSLVNIPDGDWFCCICEHVKASPHVKASKIRCFQCNQGGGAMRVTAEGAWVHIACAIFISEMKVTKEGAIQLVDHKLHKKRAKLVCSLCGLAGGCVQCCQKGCFASYHVTCCLNNGQYHSLKFNKTASDHLIASSATLCAKHSNKRLEQAQREQCEAVPAQIGRFVSDKATKKWVKSLVSAKVPDEAYDDIANYWKNKRSQINAGRSPLIRRLLIETEDERVRQALGDRKRTQFILPGTNQEKYDAMKKLRKNFEQARILVDMMHRRELKKLEIVNYYRAALTTFYLQLPLSSQFIQQHPDIFQLHHPIEIVISDGEDEETNIQCFDVERETKETLVKKELEAVEATKEEGSARDLHSEGMEIEEAKCPEENAKAEGDDAMESEMSLETLGEIKAEEKGNENNHIIENGACAKNLNNSHVRKPRLRLLPPLANSPSPSLSVSGSRSQQSKQLTSPPLTLLLPRDNNSKHQQNDANENEHVIRIEPNIELQRKILARELARFQARSTTLTTLGEIQQQTLVIDRESGAESDVKKSFAPHSFFLPARASSSSHYLGVGRDEDEDDDETYKLKKGLSGESPGRAMRTRLRAANGQAEEVIDVDLRVMSISNKRIDAKINFYGLLPDYELERGESIRKKEKSENKRQLKLKKENEKSSTSGKKDKRDKKREHSESKKRSRSDGDGDSSTRAKKKLKKEHKKERRERETRTKKNRDKPNSKSIDVTDEVIHLDSSSSSTEWSELELRKNDKRREKERRRKKEKERRKEKERKKSSNSAKKEKKHKKSKDKRDQKKKKRKSEKGALQLRESNESKEEMRKVPSLTITNSNRTKNNSSENSLPNANSNFLSNFSTTSAATQSSQLKVKKPKSLKDLSMKGRVERPSSLAGDEERERSQPSLYTYFSLATKPPPLPPGNTNGSTTNNHSLKLEGSGPTVPAATKMKLTDDDAMASSSGDDATRAHVPGATHSPAAQTNFDPDNNNNATGSSRSSAESASEEAARGSGDDETNEFEEKHATEADSSSNESSDPSSSEIDEVRENRSGEEAADRLEEEDGIRRTPTDSSQSSQSTSEQRSEQSEESEDADSSPHGLLAPTALSAASSESMDEESS